MVESLLSVLDFCSKQGFELFLVDSKFTDTFSEFVYSHWVTVVLPEEFGLGERGRAGFTRTGIIQFARQRSITRLQLRQ